MGSPDRNKDFPLSRLNDGMMFVRILCTYCKQTHHYYPSDLIRVFGDVDVDSLAHRMKCERCDGRGTMKVSTALPQGSDAVGLRIRRLVAIKFQRVPIWKIE